MTNELFEDLLYEEEGTSIDFKSWTRSGATNPGRGASKWQIGAPDAPLQRALLPGLKLRSHQARDELRVTDIVLPTLDTFRTYVSQTAPYSNP